MREFLLSVDTWVTSLLLLVCMTFFVAARSLPEGSFDPLGPGAAPEMVAGVLAALCVIVLVRSFLRSVAGVTPKTDKPSDVLERRAEPTPRALASFFGLLFLYILAFELRIAHFVVATSVFVFAATIALRGWHARTALISAVAGTAVSCLLFLVLTKFFVIRLPGAF